MAYQLHATAPPACLSALCGCSASCLGQPTALLKSIAARPIYKVVRCMFGLGMRTKTLCEAAPTMRTNDACTTHVGPAIRRDVHPENVIQPALLSAEATESRLVEHFTEKDMLFRCLDVHLYRGMHPWVSLPCSLYPVPAAFRPSARSPRASASRSIRRRSSRIAAPGYCRAYSVIVCATLHAETETETAAGATRRDMTLPY